MILVRPASAADVKAMSRVLTASIVELCAADHRQDPETIAGWTRNKTEDGVRAMLAAPGNLLLVAVDDEAVVAVGCVMKGYQIGLNYVDPTFRFRGASAALLMDMERRITEAGYTEALLTSTATARDFYLARGWIETAPGAPGTGYPMRKSLL